MGKLFKADEDPAKWRKSLRAYTIWRESTQLCYLCNKEHPHPSGFYLYLLKGNKRSVYNEKWVVVCRGDCNERMRRRIHHIKEIIKL